MATSLFYSHSATTSSGECLHIPSLSTVVTTELAPGTSSPVKLKTMFMLFFSPFIFPSEFVYMIPIISLLLAITSNSFPSLVSLIFFFPFSHFHFGLLVLTRTHLQHHLLLTSNSCSSFLCKSRQFSLKTLHISLAPTIKMPLLLYRPFSMSYVCGEGMIQTNTDL